MSTPAGMEQIRDSDWVYVVQIANKTQDCVQRNLLEIIAHLTGRKIPLFPEKETKRKGPVQGPPGSRGPGGPP